MKRLIRIFVLRGLLLPSAYGGILRNICLPDNPDAGSVNCGSNWGGMAGYGTYEGEVSNGVPNGQGTFWWDLVRIFNAPRFVIQA